MLSLTKITALPRRTRFRLYPLLKFSTNSREDKPFTPEFNRQIRNQKQEVDIDREPNKPAVDWAHDQSLFPGARLAVEKQLAELELAKPKSKPPQQPVEKAADSEAEEAELPVADALDPPEKPSHGKLPTVYVSDQNTLESKGIEIGMKPHSPEDDPRDKTVQWEEFKRAEIYELLRHMDSFKGQTRKHGNRYTNAYAIFADSLNKADFQYLQHVQTKNERQIKAMSDDDLDLFITENRRTRLERHDDITYDAFLDQLKLTKRFPEQEIEEERVRYHKDHGERARLAGLREPPFLSSREYMKAARKRAIWNIKDPRLEDLIPQDNAGNYTYQDWEHELRRDALRQRLQTPTLPPAAEKALTLRLEMAKKPSMLGVPEQLSKYTNLGATLKPLKEFHQKMLRIYGAHYELGEPNPKIPMDEQLDAGLSAAVVTAADWVEPNKSAVSAELKATHDSFFADVSDGEMEEEGREIAAMFENQEQSGANQIVENSEGEEDEEGPEGSEADEEEGGGRRGRGEFDEGGDGEMEGSEEEIRRFQEYMGEQKSFAKEEEKRLKRRWKRGYKEPTTVAAYLKMINEMEYMANADINFTEETGAVNAMARFPDARYSIGNETNMEPEIDEKEEYPEQPTDKKKLRETHNFPVRLSDWEELKFKTKQHDAMPLELQTFFDPTLRRGNEEERTMLDNLDPGMKFISAFTQIPSQFPQPRIFHVDSDVKEAIWRFNRMDPKKYHSRKLAAMFGLSIVRTQSILRLQYLEDQIAQEVGYDTELEVFEAEVEQTFDVPTAQWDPEFFNELKTRGGNYAGRQEYVDEGDLAILKRVERKRVSRYWNEYEMQILLEQNSQKHAYGALDNPLPAPVSLSAQKNPKQRYPVVLTEIADRRNGNFRIAVRDKNGVLREPDDAEFKRVRRRERGAKDYFNHIPYQFGETI